MTTRAKKDKKSFEDRHMMAAWFSPSFLHSKLEVWSRLIFLGDVRPKQKMILLNTLAPDGLIFQKYNLQIGQIYQPLYILWYECICKICHGI